MSVITCRSNQLRGARERSGRRPEESVYTYVGGTTGAWEVTDQFARRGARLVPITRLDVHGDHLNRSPLGTAWILSGLVRNTRYVTREEFAVPEKRIRACAPPAPTCAALIPIRRSPDWWQLGREARHEILEAQSQQTPSGLRYLSAIIRRWQHRLDLSEQFDCVTWFEYEPRDSAAFDDLLAEWRTSEEWKFVDRECDIRLVRSAW